MATSRLCLIPNCGKPHHSGGWCRSHRRRFSKYGDPLAGRTPPGEIRRYLRDVVFPYDKDECLIWPYSTMGRGYAVFKVEGRQTLVSRFICEEEHGPAPTPEHEAAHSCGKGHLGCVTKRHLSWKTPSGNQLDRIRHGTSNRGERNGSSKLTVQDIRQIRSLRGTMPQRDIGLLFGVNQSAIAAIQTGRRWGWVV